MQKTNRNLFLGLLSVFWFALIVTLYFVTHKPFTTSLAKAVSLIVWRLAITGLITAIAGGIGMRFIKLVDLQSLTKLGISAAFGYGILALILMITGILHGFRWFVFIPLLVLLVVSFHKEILNWLKLLGSLSIVWKETTSFWRVVGGINAGMAIFSLCTALAPPLKYDALMYHLAMPAAYLQSGSFDYLPWLAMSGMPQATEMLYTLGMALGGYPGATTLGWWFAIIALLGLLGYAREKLDNPSAWVAVSSLMAGFTFVAAMAWGYVDWLGLLFGFGGLVCLDLWRGNGKSQLLIYAGLFAGFAFSTKYTAGVLLIVLGIVFCWHCWKTRRSFFPSAFRLVVPAILVMLPWLIRNWVLTGNPVYPFFFPSGAMDEIRIAVYQGLPAWGDWRDLLLLPFQATYMGVDGRSGYSVSIGSLLLGLGALAWINSNRLDREQQSALQNAVVAAIAGIGVWAIGNQFSGYLIQTRMYFSIFPAFTILAAFGFYGISRLELTLFRPARIVTALILLVLSLNAIEIFTSLIRSSAISNILGIKSDEAYLSENLGWYDLAIQSINGLPEGSRVIMLYEPRGLYCLPICEPDEILDRWRHDLNKFGDPQVVLASWKQQGFTHILYNRAGTQFLREDQDPHHPVKDMDILDQTLNGLDMVEDFNSMYEIYNMP